RLGGPVDVERVSGVELLCARKVVRGVMAPMSAAVRGGWIALALLVLFGAACGETEDGGDRGSEASIRSFTVEPESIVEGEAALLRWSVTKAKTIRLLADGIALGSADLSAEGELE